MPSMKEYGRIGQRRYAGMFSEEFLRELQGKRGIEVYREMSENDEICGAIIYAIETLIRQTGLECSARRRQRKGTGSAQSSWRAA